MLEITLDSLSTVHGGQVPGQINQPQAVAAGAQGAQTGSTIGGAVAPAVLPLARPIGQAAGAVVGAGVGYANNVYKQVRGWFR
jgi:hypothetical protein